ncbi:MAG: hypothetical protein INR68_06100 [Methylobacterium mesophilicum]|nr:hypothetical protein [Methylobacterium mesophilicum]
MMGFRGMAFGLALLAANGAMAQEAKNAASGGQLLLELNALQTSDKGGCRLTFLVKNELNAALDKAGFEMALFDENGSVNRLAVLEFNDLPVNKTKISRFDLAGADCAKISRVLINNSSSCAGQGVDPRLCLNALKTETRTKVAFGS